MPEPVGSNYFLVKRALGIEKRVGKGSKDLDSVFGDRGSEFSNCFFMSYTRDTFVYLSLLTCQRGAESAPLLVKVRRDRFAGLLDLSVMGIWDLVILGCGGCSVHCRMFSVILGLYSVNVGSMTTLNFDDQKCPQILPTSS